MPRKKRPGPKKKRGPKPKKKKPGPKPKKKLNKVGALPGTTRGLRYRLDKVVEEMEFWHREAQQLVPVELSAIAVVSQPSVENLKQLYKALLDAGSYEQGPNSERRRKRIKRPDKMKSETLRAMEYMGQVVALRPEKVLPSAAVEKEPTTSRFSIGDDGEWEIL